MKNGCVHREDMLREWSRLQGWPESLREARVRVVGRGRTFGRVSFHRGRASVASSRPSCRGIRSYGGEQPFSIGTRDLLQSYLRSLR
jgi:hypothetical protein